MAFRKYGSKVLFGMFTAGLGLVWRKHQTNKDTIQFKQYSILDDHPKEYRMPKYNTCDLDPKCKQLADKFINRRTLDATGKIAAKQLIDLGVDVEKIKDVYCEEINESCVGCRCSGEGINIAVKLDDRHNLVSLHKLYDPIPSIFII